MKLYASTLDRAFACPGSVFAEQGITDTPNQYKAEGELLHRAMEGKIRPGEALDREQRRLIDICKDAGKSLRDGMFPGDYEWAQEWFLRYRCGDGSVSTKLDYAAWVEDAALVIDWKFGRGAVEVAESNYQLRAYAVAMKREIPTLKLVRVAIVQPYEERARRVQVADYREEDLEPAEAEFRGLFRVLNNMEGKPELRYRSPGSHCRYCKALGTERCPESSNMANSLASVPPGLLMPTGAALSDWLERCEVAEEVVAAIREHAKAELAAGNEVPGWTLKEGRRVRVIPDAVAAWNALSKVMPAIEFQASCKVSVGVLEDAYSSVTGITGKALRPAFDAALGEAITVREDRPTLARVK